MKFPIGIATLLLAMLGARAPAADEQAFADFIVKSAGVDRGLCLNLNDSSGRVSIALAKSSHVYVQGLTTVADRADTARLCAAGSDVADRVSVVWRRTPHLPYLDDLANLIVAPDWGSAEYQGLPMAEIARVLEPGGIAILGADGGADAAKLLDEAGKLKLIKSEKLTRSGAWIKLTKQMNPDFGEWGNFAGGPELNMVSPDKAFAPGKEVRWCNGARWAANNYLNLLATGGRIYHFEREWLTPASGQWYLIARDAHNGSDLWKTKIGGPTKWESNYVQTAFCADEKCVYCCGDDGVTAFDGQTGAPAFKYEIKGATQLSTSGKYLLISSNVCHVLDKETHRELWSHPFDNHQPPVQDGVAFFLNRTTLDAVMMTDGKLLWTISLKEHIPNPIMLSVRSGGGAVFIQNGSSTVAAFDAKTGKTRWTHDLKGKTFGLTVLPYSDFTYLAKTVDVKGNAGLECIKLDALSGKELKTYQGGGSGARCWSSRATERYIFGLDETTFLERQTLEIGRRLGVRPQCHSGPIVAYGLEYDAPHVCSCRTSLRGEVALSSGSACPSGVVAPVLFHGAATVNGPAAGPNDWPTDRGDGARSCASAAELPATVKLVWKTKVGTGQLPQATGAADQVFTTDPGAHRVVALDVKSGKTQWLFVTEGRVSVPPTYSQGLCLIADHAGWVYALEAVSGKLVWKLQAAPEQKYMAAYNQFESVWPVKSGVLTLGDGAFFVAGRSSTMDGGLYLIGVDARTGQERWKRNFNDIRPTDMLRTDGKLLFFGVSVVNPLDGKDAGAKLNGVLHSPPDFHGTLSLIDLLAPSDPGQTYLRKHGISDGRGEGEQLAFNASQTVSAGGSTVACKGTSTWTSKETGQTMQSLLLAGSRVYAAGFPELRNSTDPPALWILNGADGKVLQKLPLDVAPSMDALSAIDGKLLLTTVDGQVLCFGAP